MAAILTNSTGIELQLRFQMNNVVRHINNLYIPDTEAEDWDLETVVEDYAAQWDSSGLLDCLSVNCTFLDITGRVRGERPDAGVTHREVVGAAGTVVGNNAPAWLAFQLYQLPDNVNRLVLETPTSIFQKGRISMPGIPVSFIQGESVTSAAVALYVALFPYWRTIDPNANTALNPGFSLAMTRVVAGVVRAKCNITGMQTGELGTQLTARH